MATDSGRVIILGIDGVPHRLIKKFANNNVIPNIKSIIDKGIFTKMQSSIPEISSIAWSSIITGKNPAEHGIFGFTDFSEGTYQMTFPNFNTLAVPPFWNKENSRSIIINVPSTYPAGKLNGILVSGFVSLDLEKSVYPESFIPKLKKMNYEIDVDSSLAHKSMDLFLKSLDKTLNKRIELFHYLWDNEEWQNFMFVFTGSDRLFHFLWNAYEDKNHKYHKVHLNYFKKIDNIIGEINKSITDDDLFIILSDHGFESLEKNINLNVFLKEKGFLKMTEGSKGNFNDIGYGTKAFALDPGRIYINLENKYPCGTVPKKDYDKVINELIKAFNDLQSQGRKVIKKIFKKHEIYKGPLIEYAPDMVLLGESGMNLKASITATSIEEDNIFTGKHTQHDAFFLINNTKAKECLEPEFNVSDVVDIIKKHKK